MSEYTTEEDIICLRRLLHYAEEQLKIASTDEKPFVRTAIKFAQVKIEEIEDGYE